MGTMLKKRCILAAKIEVTKGTAESITASTDGAMNIYNVKITLPNDKTEREQQGSFTRNTSIVGKRMGTIAFDTDIAGSTSGVSPLESTTFLPCCARPASSNVYTRTAVVGSQKTCTIIYFKDGKKHTFVGCAGTFKDTLTDGERGVRSYTFTGKYPITSNPVDAALPSLPTFPTIKPPRGVASLTIAGVTTVPRVATLTYDAGNAVKLLEDITDETGFAYAIVTDATETITLTPEQDTLANAPWETLQASGGEVGGVTWVVGSASNNTVTFSAASLVEVKSVDDEERDGVLANSIVLAANGGVVITHS